jgi:PleD family two-component response regulator
VSHFPQDGTLLEELVRVADERLYKAKRAGKNRVCGRD